MNVEDLRQASREHSTVFLNALVMECRHRGSVPRLRTEYRRSSTLDLDGSKETFG